MTVDNLIIKLKHFSFVLSSKSVTLQQLSLYAFLSRPISWRFCKILNAMLTKKAGRLFCVFFPLLRCLTGLGMFESSKTSFTSPHATHSQHVRHGRNVLHDIGMKVSLNRK